MDHPESNTQPHGAMRPLPDRSEWIGQAACKGKPVEIFFPGRGKSTAEAVAICNSCPVIDQCRDYVLEVSQYEELIGVWAGMSHKKRIQYAKDAGLKNSRSQGVKRAALR